MLAVQRITDTVNTMKILNDMLEKTLGKDTEYVRNFALSRYKNFFQIN